jgi:hypothetical protein
VRSRSVSVKIQIECFSLSCSFVRRRIVVGTFLNESESDSSDQLIAAIH